MFHEGISSTSGHYTVAARQHQGDQPQKGDTWLYYNSGSPPVPYTMEALSDKFSRNVVGLLLVSKTAPADMAGQEPLLIMDPDMYASLISALDCCTTGSCTH